LGRADLDTKAEHLVAYQHPPGSNGGVHRGPDRYPRVSQAQFMKALAQSQFRDPAPACLPAALIRYGTLSLPQVIASRFGNPRKNRV